MTPPDFEVDYVDEFVRPIDYAIETDLVAITAMTAQAANAYRIADEFRKRRKPVVIGGIHPTILPEEALKHADAVVVGEAESVWSHLCEDFLRGTLQKTYRASSIPSDFCISGQFPRRDLLQVEGYTRSFDGDRALDTLQTTRGCIYDCEHCNVPVYYGRKLRSRPVDEVMEELQQVEAKNVFIVDNLIFENRKYMMEFLRRMEEIDTKWMGVGSLKMADDTEFLDAMARSGCAFLYMGFDHLYENTYEGHKKNLPGHYREDLRIHDVDYSQDHVKLDREYREKVKIIQDAGIGVFGTFAFGFDNDDESIFERTIDFALGTDLQMADFAIVTPYPKSPLHTRLIIEDRLFDTNWDHYNGCHVVFKPKNMSAERLKEGWQWSWDEFYRVKTVLRRLCEAFLPKEGKRRY